MLSLFPSLPPVSLVGLEGGSNVTRIGRFANYLRSILPHPDVTLTEMTARAIGQLALAEGTYTAEYVEFEVKRAFEWITGAENKKLAAVSVNGYGVSLLPSFLHIACLFLYLTILLAAFSLSLYCSPLPPSLPPSYSFSFSCSLLHPSPPLSSPIPLSSLSCSRCLSCVNWLSTHQRSSTSRFNSFSTTFLLLCETQRFALWCTPVAVLRSLGQSWVATVWLNIYLDLAKAVLAYKCSL